MEQTKTLKTTRSWSYRQGFKKGIEIVNNNHLQHGYFFNEKNKKAIKGLQKQIDEGVDKNRVKLTYQQIEWRKGMVDGIMYRCGSSHQREESPFERYERIHTTANVKLITA